MAKTKKEPGSADDLELNMTPMIDVVFNLIIFFMIVTDMTQKELEDLKLPDSKASVEDKDDQDDVRVIINITKHRENWDTKREVEIKIKAQKYDLAALKAHLWKLAETKRNPDDPSGANPSEVYVLIRCDKDIPWKEVQWVMQACADPDVRIYKLQFATAEHDAEGS
jgi:biopolymer transport protein ExbD